MEDQTLGSSLFISLVHSLNLTALQQLGSVVNPFTGHKEVDIESAEVTVNIIRMLETKTRQNLSPDEEHYLREVLSHLEQLRDQAATT